MVDVDGYICPHVGACGSSLNGQELRPDGLQYADPGGGLLATWIVRELTQPRRWVIMAAEVSRRRRIEDEERGWLDLVTSPPTSTFPTTRVAAGGFGSIAVAPWC